MKNTIKFTPNERAILDTIIKHAGETIEALKESEKNMDEGMKLIIKATGGGTVDSLLTKLAK